MNTNTLSLQNYPFDFWSSQTSCLRSVLISGTKWTAAGRSGAILGRLVTAVESILAAAIDFLQNAFKALARGLALPFYTIYWLGATNVAYTPHAMFYDARTNLLRAVGSLPMIALAPIGCLASPSRTLALTDRIKLTNVTPPADDNELPLDNQPQPRIVRDYYSSYQESYPYALFWRPLKHFLKHQMRSHPILTFFAATAAIHYGPRYIYLESPFTLLHNAFSGQLTAWAKEKTIAYAKLNVKEEVEKCVNRYRSLFDLVRKFNDDHYGEKVNLTNEDACNDPHTHFSPIIDKIRGVTNPYNQTNDKYFSWWLRHNEILYLYDHYFSWNNPSAKLNIAKWFLSKLES